MDEAGPARGTRRVLVIGGGGYLGSIALESLNRAKGIEAVAGSRRGEVRIDLNDAATFDGLDGFDAIVNCSDSVIAPPDEAIARVLERGGLWLEATADPGTARRLIKRFRGIEDAKGSVVLGVGIFPGLSNLLARRVFEVVEDADTIELGVALTPFAGAGTGTIRLMSTALDEPGVIYAGGRRVEGPPLRRGRRMEFNNGPCDTVQITLPEVEMLRASLGAANVVTAMLASPVARAVAPGAAWVLYRLPWVRKPVLWCAHRWWLLVRGRLLRSKREPIELAATARNAAGDSASGVLRVEDGFGVGGLAIASTADLLTSIVEPPRGFVLVDEVLEQNDVIDGMWEIAGKGLKIEGW